MLTASIGTSAYVYPVNRNNELSYGGECIQKVSYTESIVLEDIAIESCRNFLEMTPEYLISQL
jgi:hypothetical protein